MAEMTATAVPQINAVQELMKPRLRSMGQAKNSAAAILIALLPFTWMMANQCDRPKAARDWMCNLVDRLAVGAEEFRR